MLLTDRLLAHNLIPDWLIRLKIRILLRQRLVDEQQGGVEEIDRRFRTRLAAWSKGPIAINTQDANDQHYEVPPSFFTKVLGKHLKYSCCYFNNPTDPLDVAEATMLQMSCDRAELEDGQHILELGCGWGSLSLWMAEHYPQARITSVSNSADQRKYIEEQIQQRGLKNLKILTFDMNIFDTQETFDRVVSVEMFEHMRNHQQLMTKVASWLKPGGKVFIHVFSHTDLTYPYEVLDDSDWMSKYFFTGGMMPSDHYLMRFQHHVTLEDHWRMSGLHYMHTSERWLQNLDRHQEFILDIFAQSLPLPEARLKVAQWRIFFMACAELWKYRQGAEWVISHYRFVKK